MDSTSKQAAVLRNPEISKEEKSSFKSALLAGLKSCGSSKNLAKGKKLHTDAIERGQESDVYVANTLINMYAQCGAMANASRLFEAMAYHTVVSWNVLLLGYATNGEEELALELFVGMRLEGLLPDAFTFVAGLKACAKLGKSRRNGNAGARSKLGLIKGRAVHSQAASSGLDTNILVASNLVSMYAQCGSLLDARRIFDRMETSTRLLVCWNVLMNGYAENQPEVALELFGRMDCEPNGVTFCAALKAWTSLAAKEQGDLLVDGRIVKVVALAQGKAIHERAEKSGLGSDTYVASALVSFYARCGSVEDAKEVFRGASSHTGVWNAMVRAYVENGLEEQALELFERMIPPPDAVTFLAALKACANLATRDDVDDKLGKVLSLEKARAIDCECEKQGFDRDVYISSALVNAFARCGSMVDAKRVFDRFPGTQTLVTWNVLLLGYAENDDEERALNLFAGLLRDNEHSTTEELTFVAVLKACINLALKEECPEGRKIKASSLSKGKFVHSQATQRGFESGTLVGNTLIDFYMKCGTPVRAWLVFQAMGSSTAVTWTSMILGSTENGDAEFALDLFFSMEQCCVPDAQAIVAALKACTGLAAREEGRVLEGKLVKTKSLEIGKAIHIEAVELGHESNSYVASTLVDMYAKCGSMENSREIFYRSQQQQRSVVSWTALIFGYAENGEAAQALEEFSRMRTVEALRPNAQTLATALSACSSAVALELGRAVHAEACRFGHDCESILANCLMDMYSKCGDLAAAQRVLDSTEFPDSVAWNTVIAGFSRVGDWKMAFDLFGEMLGRGIPPVGATFVCLLTACSHAGLVAKGMEFFQAMQTKYGVSPQIEHWTCLVDLLCRAYELDHAIALARSLPCGKADEFVWTTIVNACKMAGKHHKYQNF
ncbi:pentatricopeptide repeat-containing protein At3g09040, mitochondrial-like [Selaginella moellendorffii]|uniref:pentatricopeptide repeat-containing protein At3g09040, mitochondrial-like n=1 Tax=Selaginella moellendorffii TaxID=88036 RepID=UPI000D1C3AF5|nr:pentatricopeptide repeat-containing protein At3g09040, mitochondrial-like [Selaginella moellendorffii]|eukprot:XP_024525795.1 pentatricopeptide repeat-containing protein At3g09040, mitochondrial-like [Selaginella moellendorffii]